LEARVERLEVREKTLVEHRAMKPDIIVDLLSVEEEQGVFDRFRDRVQQQLAQSMQFVWVDQELIFSISNPLTGEKGLEEGLLPMLSEEAMTRYANFATHFWEFLRQQQDLAVEAILEQRDVDPQAVGEDWLGHAAPLISLGSYEHKHAPIFINILGAQRGNKGFFKGVTLPGLTIEATGKPFETVVISTVLGINPLALASSKGMKDAHDQLLVEGEPIYVYPEARPKKSPDKAVKKRKQKGKKKKRKNKK
jgi:hypothetical protein